MWTRAELKNKAKFSFKRNYWKCVLISLLLAIFVGGSTGVGSASSAFSSGYEDSYSVRTGDYEQYLYDGEGFWDEFGDAVGNINPAAAMMATAVFVVVFIIIFLVVMTIVILLEAFIFNPLEVGCKRFYFRNLNENALVGNIGYAFDNNYKNIAKIMFYRDLYTVLWSFLFIVPGIVKSYEYQMIPYLLAENPHMTKEEAFAESRRMMDGQKWNAFVLDLSFIGWDILSAMTLGIVGVLYVQPYMDATPAALYETLRYHIPQNDTGWSQSTAQNDTNWNQSTTQNGADWNQSQTSGKHIDWNEDTTHNDTDWNQNTSQNNTDWSNQNPDENSRQE